jgi:hypothetical protein
MITPSAPKRALGHGVVARLPIGVKLPLAAGLLVLLVSAVMAYASYSAFRSTLIATAIDREQQKNHFHDAINSFAVKSG